jgi:hypothetical protein
MAHGIEELDLVLSTTSTEWHGLAKVVPEINEEVIAPLCFDIVQGAPMAKMANGDVIEITGQKTLVANISHRTDLTNPRKWHVIHTPKDSYEVIPNREVFEMAKASFEALGCKLLTAGTLGNLTKFFLSVDIGNAILTASNGDKFENYFNFITSHDGTYALECYDSAIRIVCMNTFRWSRETQGEVGIKMFHTKNVQKQMDNLPAYLATLISNRQKMVESMDLLIGLECSPAQAAYAAAGYLAGPDASELSMQGYNRANSIRDLALGGKGNNGKNRYDLLNGFTEFFTHHEGAGGKKADKGKRMSAAKFGMAADHKDNFLNLVLNESDYQENLGKGEKMYRDKMQAVLA